MCFSASIFGVFRHVNTFLIVHLWFGCRSIDVHAKRHVVHVTRTSPGSIEILTKEHKPSTVSVTPKQVSLQCR